ncbi:MAG: TIGR03936 family radical SAM-associated protein [Phycisphaerae bacterium]
MTTSPSAHSIRRQVAPVPDAYGYLLEYAVLDDLRFLSHHDEITLLRRALVRAGLPVTHSRGFNPIPQMSLVLPRNVGVASAMQLAQVKLDTEFATEKVFEQLHAVMPVQAPLRKVATAPRTAIRVTGTTFAVSIDPADRPNVLGRVAELQSLKTYFIERDMGPKKPPRKTDIRGFVHELNLADDTLHMKLHVERQASARPAEILEALGLPASRYLHRVCRTELLWQEAK